jgi:hypothetical protein
MARAKARRKEAIERSAPQVANMYGSDESQSSSSSSEGEDKDREIEVGEDEEDLDDAAWAKLVQAGKLSKGERLAAVDHSSIGYPPFRKVCSLALPLLANSLNLSRYDGPSHSEVVLPI